MSITEAVPIETNQGTIYAYPPKGDPRISGQRAEISTPGANYNFSEREAQLLAETISPAAQTREEIADEATQPYQDKARVALQDLRETITSWTRSLNAAREGEWSGSLVADSMEELLLALSETVVSLSELSEGNL